MTGKVKVGTVEGTGSAINIQLGWIPDYVKVINTEDRDVVHEWFNGMTDGHAIKTTTAVASLTSNGISAYQGVRGSAAKGFTIGTDVSEADKTLHYIAIRN